jgi:hypothetical protein
MRFLAITLFGIYQIGRSSLVLEPAPKDWQSRTSTRGGQSSLATIYEEVKAPLPGPFVDTEYEEFLAADAKQEKMRKIKTAMEHLDIPRGYIEACLVAMDAERGRHVMSFAGVAPITEIAEKLNLEEKLGKFKTDYKQLDPEYAHDADKVAPCLAELDAQYAWDEYMAESALQAKRLALKQHMELLHVPTEYIRACFVAMMGEGDARHLMTIPEYATISGEVKLTFEQMLSTLRIFWTDDEFGKCFDAMESNHKDSVAKATKTINRVVQEYIAAKKIRDDRIEKIRELIRDQQALIESLASKFGGDELREELTSESHSTSKRALARVWELSEEDMERLWSAAVVGLY